jgi:multiple sugar transport system permease protein
VAAGAVTPPIPREPRGARATLRRARHEWTAYAFITPAFVVFSVFTAFALFFLLYMTFHEWSIIQPQKPFVGLDNYRDLVHDERFRRSVINTFYYTGAQVPLTMAVGLGIALLLNLPLRGRGVMRTMFFLPNITPLVVVAIVWKWLYNGDFGLFNFYLLKLHLIDQPLLFLADKNLAMPSVVLMQVWNGVGFAMVVYLAGLQAIPEELYEAAKVDGAGPFQRLRRITLPMLRPSTIFLVVIEIIFAFQIFTQIFVMTSGGPVDRTTTVVYYIYESAFKFFEMGYASTVAFALFLMLFVFTLAQIRIQRRSES